MMDQMMSQWGYTYEPMKVETDDGFILTLFHITGKVGQEPFMPSQPPVYVQHGAYQDGATWLRDQQKKPF